MKKLFSLILLLSFTIKAQDVTIGTQTWTSKNLDVSKFRNGEVIPLAKTDAEWVLAGQNKQPAWCYYENKTANDTTYGKLYNWFAVNDARGLAPKGYHIPTDAEWTTLTDYLGGESVAGTKMKSTSGWGSYTTGRGIYNKTCPNCKKWSKGYRDKFFCHTCNGNRLVSAYEPVKTHSANGTNTSGFAGLPGGNRDTYARFSRTVNANNGGVEIVLGKGYWWSSSENNTKFALFRSWGHPSGYLDNSRDSYNKRNGFSVRCLRD